MIDLQWPHAISARLAIFENNGVNTDDIREISFNFNETSSGKLYIDDIQFTK